MNRNRLDEVANQWVFNIAEFHNSHASWFCEGRSWTQALAVNDNGQRFASTTLFSSPRATGPNQSDAAKDTILSRTTQNQRNIAGEMWLSENVKKQSSRLYFEEQSHPLETYPKGLRYSSTIPNYDDCSQNSKCCYHKFRIPSFDGFMELEELSNWVDIIDDFFRNCVCASIRTSKFSFI